MDEATTAEPERSAYPVDTVTDPKFGIPLGPGVISTHSEFKCAGENCVIHNPSEHHMRDWPLTWRSDKQCMERTCPHGVGHPDPDGAEADKRLGNAWKNVHGCDGCCGDNGSGVTADKGVNGPGQGGHPYPSLQEAVDVPKPPVIVKCLSHA